MIEPQYIIGGLIGWVVAGALLLIEHAYFDSEQEETRYMLGAGALCIGMSVAGVIAGSALLVIIPWAVASSGLVIVVIQWYERKAEAGRTTAQKRGEIIGAAKGLTQEMIDRGNNPTRHHN